VTISGWVDTCRDHKGVLFVDLRDRYGKTQVVFAPESGEDVQRQARSLRSEYVVSVMGKVAPRPEGTVNPKLETGAIEVRAESLVVLNPSLTPPFQPGSPELPGEDLRLKATCPASARPATGWGARASTSRSWPLPDSSSGFARPTPWRPSWST